MTKSWILYCLNIFLTLQCLGQDFHWSQFQSAPYYINPAQTGLFDYEHLRKTVRASINWREQWRTIQSPFATGATPFSTYSFALDGNISRLPLMGEDIIGVGIAVFKDEAGDLNFSTNQLNLYVAYHKAINRREDQFISLGMQYGFANHYIDFSKASYDSQWDGKEYNPNNSSGENLQSLSKGYRDFSLGISHFIAPHYGIKMRTGISAHHLNKPPQSLYNQSAPMFINWVFNHEMHIPAWKRWNYMPALLIQKQGPATEGVIYNGFRIGSSIDEYHQFGIGYRIVGNYKSPINHDALYLGYKLGINNWSLGFSYDINVSRLNNATSTIGAFEIAIVWHGHPFNKPKAKHHRSKNKCPEVHPSGKKKIIF